MSDNINIKNKIGAIEWQDLTVKDAESIRDFYTSVVGWNTSPVSMGDYNDFNVNVPQAEETVAGICHARGTNANLPAQWLMYVRVENVATSAKQCIELGGSVLDGPRKMGADQFCVIQDPAGAVLGLVSK